MSNSKGTEKHSDPTVKVQTAVWVSLGMAFMTGPLINLLNTVLGDADLKGFSLKTFFYFLLIILGVGFFIKGIKSQQKAAEEEKQAANTPKTIHIKLEITGVDDVSVSAVGKKS